MFSYDIYTKKLNIMDEDTIESLEQSCDKILELIKQKKIEEAYTVLYKVSTAKSNIDLTDSERIALLYTQAAYFQYYNQIVNTCECCREIIKLVPSTDHSLLYCSMACLLYSKTLFSQGNNIYALKVAQTGFSYLKIIPESENSLDILKEYKELVDIIESSGNSTNFKPKKRFFSVAHAKPYKPSISDSSKLGFLPIISHNSVKKPEKIINPSLLNQQKIRNLNSIYFNSQLKVPNINFKAEKRHNLNKSVQIRRKCIENTSQTPDLMRILACKWKIISLNKNFLTSNSIKAVKPLVSIPKSVKPRGFSSILPPIAEIS